MWTHFIRLNKGQNFYKIVNSSVNTKSGLSTSEHYFMLVCGMSTLCRHTPNYNKNVNKAQWTLSEDKSRSDCFHLASLAQHFLLARLMLCSLVLLRTYRLLSALLWLGLCLACITMNLQDLALPLNRIFRQDRQKNCVTVYLLYCYMWVP